jgi:hypothetical protein
MNKPWSILLLTLCASAGASAAGFSFGLWGDMPYARFKDDARTAAVMDSINRAHVAFSIHNGDIKDGSSVCNDAVYDHAKALFNSMKAPLVYAPGDNEWADCHRSNNGGYNNLERLQHLRTSLFELGWSFAQRKMPISNQAAPFVENTRFSHGGVMFVQVNVPGSNNNRVFDRKECTFKSARTWADCEADNAEYAVRNVAVNRWITESFELARSSQARGLVITLQADPGFDLPETEHIDEAQVSGWNREASGYRDLMMTIMAQTRQFDGQVLFAHGDTHVFKIDKPLAGPFNILPNFTRVTTFGSPNNHWVQVEVDTRRPEVFTIRPVMVPSP